MYSSRMAIWLLIITGLPVQAQVVLERSVLSPFALEGAAGGQIISSTAGQPDYTTLSNAPVFFTQGFEQPLAKVPLVFHVDTIFNQCTGLFEFTITGLSGCVTSADAFIRWNNAPGDTVFTAPLPQVLLSIAGPVGCYASVSVDASEASETDAECIITFYSFISPNGDGMNDAWVIEGIDAPRYGRNVVRIIGRWGQEVWSAVDYNNSSRVWAGQDAQGQDLPDGTYFYHVTIDEAVYQGYIELQR